MKRGILKDKIGRVNDNSNELINYLTKIGIKLAKEIEVVEKLGFDNSVIVKIDSKNHSLSEIVASNVFLERLN